MLTVKILRVLRDGVEQDVAAVTDMSAPVFIHCRALLVFESEARHLKAWCELHKLTYQEENVWIDLENRTAYFVDVEKPE